MADIEKDELITLYDEDGNAINFVVVDGVEHNGKCYLALVEEEHYDDEECEFTVLRVDESENDEDNTLSTIEDETEFNDVMRLFEEKLDSEYDIEDTFDFTEDSETEDDGE